MKRSWVWGIGALALTFFLIALQMRNSKTSEGAPSSRPPSPDLVSKENPNSQVSVSPKADAVKFGPPSSAALPPVADARFQAWIAEEAKSLDNPSADSEHIRQEIRRAMASLSKSQSQQLLHTARDPEAPANEKILATFLMVEGGLSSRHELMDFISDPAISGGEPHSMDEINSVRDKSLRIMALDGLFTQAATDPSARAALGEKIAAIQDPYVKAYAERRFEELTH